MMKNLLKSFIKKLFYIFILSFILFLNFSNNILLAQNKFLAENIKISEEFDLNFSKDKVIEKAFKKGFSDILFKILTYENYIKIKDSKLDEIKPLIENFKIKDENFQNNKYFAKFDINFSKKKIFNFLKNKNFFFSIPSKINVIFYPIVIENEEIKIFEKNLFYLNWNKVKDQKHLINYILPLEDIDDLNSFMNIKNDVENFDMEKITKKYNNQNYIFAIINKNNKQLNIFSKIFFNGKKINSNLIINSIEQNQKELELDIDELKIHYEDIWKKENLIETSIKLSFYITLTTNEFNKIKKFENNLNDIELINSFSIINFNLDKSVYEIVYNGSPDMLINKFTDYSILLTQSNNQWFYNGK